MKKRITVYMLGGTLVALAMLIIYGCKKNVSNTSEYTYFERTMSGNQEVVSIQTNLENISKGILTEAYLKRKELPKNKITNSLTPFIKGKQAELRAAANKVKNDVELKTFLNRIGLGAQADSYIKLSKDILTKYKRFYTENPSFKELSQREQVELLAGSVKKIGEKKRGVFKKIQNPYFSEPDPCWDTWSDSIEDAQDDMYWETIAAAVGYGFCLVGTEGIGIVLCDDAYAAALALIALKYVDNVSKADDRYNECEEKDPYGDN